MKNVPSVVLFSLLSMSVFARDCWWVGNASSDPMVSGNWYGGVPTEADRACVNDGTTHIMTIPAGANLVCKHFALGVDKSLMDNSVTMNGGTLTTKGDFSIGNYPGSGGTFTLNGGTITIANILYVGQGENSGGLFKMTDGTLTVGGDIILNALASDSGRFEMTGGTINMAAGKSFAVPRRGVASAVVSGSGSAINFNGAYLYLAAGYSWDKLTSGKGTFTLADGATLNGMGYIEVDGLESAFICNGGVLVCSKAGNLFTGSGALHVGNGGITVDTKGFNITLNKPMLAADGATAGGLVKKGTGTLTLSRGNTYLPGPVDIQAGKVIARAPNALPGYATHDFKLAAGAELELGGAWSVEQVNAIKALPTVLGTVTHNRAIDENVTIADNLTPADVSETGKLLSPMTGGAMLTLTGHNDLGGEFRVNSGVLAADFGQGLATTDHLTLGEDNGFNNYTPGLFAPLSGLVTCNIGTGGGEISFGTNGMYYSTEAGFAGVVPTTVNLFNDARVLKVNQELPRKLVFNTTAVTNTVHFENPIDLNGSPANIDITVQGGEAYLDGGIDGLVNGTPSNSVGAMAKKGSGILHMPMTSTFNYVYSQGGLLAFPAGVYDFWRIQTNGKDARTEFAAGAKVTLNNLMTSTAGSLIVNEGCEVTTSAGGTFSSSSTAIFSNATWTVTGGDVVVNRNSTDANYPNGASVLIKGGTFKNTGTGWMQVQEAGELVFDGCTAEINPQVNAGRSSAADSTKSKVIIRGGAQMKMGNLVAMSGAVEISGDDTKINLAGLWQGESDTAASAGATGKILVTGGQIIPTGDVRVGYRSGSVGLMRFEGGSITLASAKSLAVGSAGNGTLEVAGGLVDVSGADGVAVLPTWQAEEATYKKTPGGLIRFLGGEVKARKIYGNATRGKAEVDIDGGKVTFVNATQTTLFSGMTARRVGINGGEIDSGTVNVTMGGALTTLTNQTKIVATGAALNTAKTLAKSGSSTLTLVGANTYSCGTEVEAGTLVLQGGASLSEDQFLRVGADAVLDLGGNRQTVSAVLGTGTVKSGSLTVTEAIYPAGVGTVGTLTFTDVVPSGRVVIDVDGQTGACDKLVVNGTLDASKLEFEIADVTALEKTKLIRVVEATAITGRPTITNLPGNYSLSTGPTSITIARGGLVFYVR